MKTVKKAVAHAADFFAATIWEMRREDCGFIHWQIVRLLRTGILAIRGFSRNNGPMRASALTFFSLLSLVPVAAMAFAIAKGFGFERRLKQELLKNFSAQQDAVEKIIEFAQKMLDNTRGDMIAGVGIIVLFWAVIKVLGHIEGSFNHIWGVSSRSAVRKLSDYLTIMLIGPVLMIMSSSVTVFINHQVSVMSGRFELVEMVGPAIYTAIKLLPYALIWVLFTLVYLVMPNTRVPFGAALLAGTIAGSAYQVVQAFYIYFQINMSSYNAIYGSFAALPLFLVWLQISWYIVIIGAEISYAYWRSAFVDQSDDVGQMSVRQTRLLALAVCRQVVGRFYGGQPAQTGKEIAGALSLSPRLVDKLEDLLIQGGILVRVDAGENHAQALLPARDISRLTVNDVMSALEDVGSNGRPLHMPHAKSLSETLTAFRNELDRSDANRLIKNL